MASNKPFSYTEDEGQNIIVEETLLGDHEESTQTADSSKLFFDLLKLSEKELKLQMHIVTLSDYWRKSMIPRGLRLNKFPTFGYDNEEFKSKWEAILNKCSLDLILLLIEEAKKEKNNIQTQIEDKRADLTQATTEEKRCELEKKVKEDVDKLSLKTKQVKIAKFKRDLEDYNNGTVYTWGKKQRRRRTVSFNIPSTDEEDYDERSTSDGRDIPHSSGRPQQKVFLDMYKSHKKRRGKPEGAGEGEGRPPRRPNTRSRSQNRL